MQPLLGGIVIEFLQETTSARAGEMMLFWTMLVQPLLGGIIIEFLQEMTATRAEDFKKSTKGHYKAKRD